MATALDTKILPRVLALVARFGRDVAFTAAPTYAGPTTGGSSAGASLATVKAVVGAYELRYVDGDVIKAGDLRLLIAGSGLSFTPSAGQTCSVDSQTWKVVAVRPISSGEQNAAWELQVRR